MRQVTKSVAAVHSLHHATVTAAALETFAQSVL